MLASSITAVGVEGVQRLFWTMASMTSGCRRVDEATEQGGRANLDIAIESRLGS
jgi:hypothetical protein